MLESHSTPTGLSCDRHNLLYSELCNNDICKYDREQPEEKILSNAIILFMSVLELYLKPTRNGCLVSYIIRFTVNDVTTIYVIVKPSNQKKKIV